MRHSSKRPSAFLIARTYLDHPGMRFSDLDPFQRWIMELFHQLPFKVEWVDGVPYPNNEAMRVDLDATGVLKVSVANNDALLDPAVNLAFRAVHDFDHYRFGLGFGFEGERRAARAIMSRCGDDLGRQLLFSEIVGQAAVATQTGRFAPQRFVPFALDVMDGVLFG